MAARMMAALGVVALSLMAAPGEATERLTVMTSGGFAHAYDEVLPEFTRTTGIAVTTLSGASQGTGPKTIKAQLAHGVDADVVILSKEGLRQLIEAGLIADGSEVELARTPLAAAVRAGRPRPDIGTIPALRQALLDARRIVMPGSTSGLFVRDEVLPKLGIADRVSLRLVARGLESTALLAAGEADLALGPASELVDQPGIESLGPLPDAVQLVQVFTAANTRTSARSAEAKRLTDFLTSDRAAAAIRRAAMEPVGGPGRP